MDEWPKHVRFVHYTLVMLCFAVLAFAWLPAHGASDAAASQALIQLRSNLEDYDAGLFRRWISAQADARLDVRPRVMQVLDELGILRERELPVEHLVLVEVRTEFIGPSVFGPPMTLRQLVQELRTPADAQAFHFDELEAALRRALFPFRHTNATVAAVRLEQVERAARQRVGGWIELSIDRATFERNLSRIRADLPTHESLPSVDRGGTNAVAVTVPVAFDGQLMMLPSISFPAWRAASLSDASGRALSTIDLVPEALRARLGELADMTVPAAQREMANRRSAASQYVSLVGVSVPQGLAIVAAPAATLLLLMYMLVHLRRCLSAPRDVLWIAVFPDRLSRRLTDASIAILPLAANLTLALRDLRVREVAWWAGMALTALGLAACSQVALPITTALPAPGGTASPTHTPAPSFTPTATFTPTPSHTPTVTHTPSQTPTQTATFTPVYLEYGAKGVGDAWQVWATPGAGHNLFALQYDWYYDWSAG